MDTLGNVLKNLREDKELQQKDLALILNVHKGSISNWETDKRTPDKNMLIKIADYFDVTLDFLLGRIINKNSNTYTTLPDTGLKQKIISIENTNIGKKIQILRENLNLTQKELAEKIGVTDATMSRYENDKREPKAEILGRLALIFNTTTDYLIGLTDNKNANAYNTILNSKNYTIQINKNLKQEITQDELNKMIKKLKTVGFDVNKLLKK